jgi:cytochrome c biogenesis protein CcdA
MQATPTRSEEVTGKAVAALIFSLLGLVGWCPCIGSILGIVLGAGQKNGVARAAVILGWIGLGLIVLIALVFGAQMLLLRIADHV